MPLGEPCEAHDAQRVAHRGGDVGPRPPPHLQRKGDVIEDGQVREEGVVLEDHADVALLGRQASDVHAVDEDCPAVGATKPAIISMIVVLPEPLGPRRVMNSPWLDDQIDGVDGDDRAVVLGDVAQRQVVSHRVSHVVALPRALALVDSPIQHDTGLRPVPVFPLQGVEEETLER